MFKMTTQQINMSNYPEIIANINEYVKNLFNQYPASDLVYHNLKHTEKVVENAAKIAGTFSLCESEMFILVAAAWFHDTGHLFGTQQLHEDHSVQIMKNMLKEQNIDKKLIDEIEKCICATKFPHKPKSLLEEIICDADTYNLGTEDFLITDDSLKKELELRSTPTKNWEENTLDFLISHKYFTPYCRELLNRGKEENIDLVRYLLQKK